jgi:hypothetical protein
MCHLQNRARQSAVITGMKPSHLWGPVGSAQTNDLTALMELLQHAHRQTRHISHLAAAR